jgi:glycerophosphoryl diester phosphodiesterase
MNLSEASSVLFGAMRDFLRTWRRMLATDLVFKLLAFALLAPLVGLALRMFLSLSGNSLLADQDILLFVVSPLGIETLVVVAAGVIAITAFEQAA